MAGAEQFTSDPELRRALVTLAETADSRTPLLLLAEILRVPGLFERLAEVLRPGTTTQGEPGSRGATPAASLRN